MNKLEFWNKWIAALRSGKYTQGQRLLHVNGNYCCLGVACDLYDPNGWQEGGLKGLFDYNYDYPLSGSLSDAMREKLGISADLQTYLINMNDFHHKTFNEIADYLEKHKPSEDVNV